MNDAKPNKRFANRRKSFSTSFQRLLKFKTWHSHEFLLSRSCSRNVFQIYYLTMISTVTTFLFLSLISTYFFRFELFQFVCFFFETLFISAFLFQPLVNQFEQFVVRNSRWSSFEYVDQLPRNMRSPYVHFEITYDLITIIRTNSSPKLFWIQSFSRCVYERLWPNANIYCVPNRPKRPTTNVCADLCDQNIFGNVISKFNYVCCSIEMCIYRNKTRTKSF